MSIIRKSETLEAVEAIIHYHFNDTNLLWEALQAAGAPFIFAGGTSHADGNKRPAVVGDVVLKLALVEDWYQTGANRERADTIIKEVATNENLDRAGKALGLDEYVNVPDSMRGLPVPWRTMAATMEAILGAVYFDGSMVAVKQVVRTMGLVPTEIIA